MTSASARYPGRAPIDAYGNGGFRFAEMSHRGSILCLPSGIFAGPPTHPGEIEAAALAPVLAEKDALGLLPAAAVLDDLATGAPPPLHSRLTPR